MSFESFAVVTVRGNDYRINFWFMTKGEAVDRMKIADLSKKEDNYYNKNIIYYSDGKQCTRNYDLSTKGRWRKKENANKKVQDIMEKTKTCYKKWFVKISRIR